MIHALYLNGLTDGTTRRREQLAMRYLAKRGIQVEHIQIDWRSDKPFETLLERITTITKQRLQEHGELLLIGSSAGGSLAINVLGNIRSKNLRAVTLCSRLHLAKLSWWDHRTLKRMAYLGAPKQSQKFYDSVVYCTKTTIPSLTKADKQRIAIIQQEADTVVPRATMGIDGVPTYRVPAVGHGWGIALAVRRLPKILPGKGWQHQTMKPLSKAAFWLVLAVSTYHLIRDLLQTFNLDSTFTDIAHRPHEWCGGYCDVVTIPFDLLGILIAAIVLKRNRVGALGVVLLAALPAFVVFTLLP